MLANDARPVVFSELPQSKAARPMPLPRSPTPNLCYQLAPNVQLFARSGFGFHFNDARGMT
ncbi:MAG TPA: hypothetical protein VF598_07660 [Hymenobacter sp.]